MHTEIKTKKIMANVVIFNTGRDTYGKEEAMNESITVGELIDKLKIMDEDAKVIYSNDNGYTYGFVRSGRIVEEYVETEEEDEEELPNEGPYIIEDELEDIIDEFPQIDDDDEFFKKNNIEARFCDEKIDDGVDEDDSEDEYVMCRSYDIKYKGMRFYLRAYFGNNTREVTYYTIRVED